MRLGTLSLMEQYIFQTKSVHTYQVAPVQNFMVHFSSCTTFFFFLKCYHQCYIFILSLLSRVTSRLKKNPLCLYCHCQVWKVAKRLASIWVRSFVHSTSKQLNSCYKVIFYTLSCKACKRITFSE